MKLKNNHPSIEELEILRLQAIKMRDEAVRASFRSFVNSISAPLQRLFHRTNNGGAAV